MKNHRNEVNIATNPHLFAAYLNLARHNAFLTITEICKRLGKGEIASDDGLFSNSVFDPLKETNARDFPNQAQKTLHLLYRYFPIMESVERELVFQNRKSYDPEIDLKEQKPEPHEIRGFFEILFKNLNGYRNFASHPGQEMPKLPYVIIACMKQIYDAAKRRVKERKQYSEDDMKHLDRWMVTKDENGDKKVVEKTRFAYKLADDEDNLTSLGLAFFICLFLDKKQSHLFLNQFDAFKILATKEKAGEQKERDKAVAAFEVFTAYRMKIPSLRIESEDSQSQLFMDMLGELKRCPRELYEHISEADQDRFWVNPEDEDIEKETRDSVFSYENGEEQEVLLMRHNDRFAGLAMRFLDESLAFQQLRFMIDLGNYHHKVYPKKIGGEWQMRRLTQKLISYGRLQDFSIEKLRERYGDIVKDPATIGLMYDQPYIAATHPHYHYFDDNIAVKMVEKEFDPWPSLESEKPSGKPSRADQQPDLYISRDELFSIALYATLTRMESKDEGDKRKNKVEEIIRQYRFRMIRFFTAVKNNEFLPLDSNEYPFVGKGADAQETRRRKEALQSRLDENFKGLLTAHIPDDLLSYLINTEKEPVHAAAAQKLERMIRQTESRLRRLERDLQLDKIGKANHREVRKGTLGTFIAKDLMMFQPVNKEGRGKATGLLFQTLQASIAFYMRDKTILRKLFRDCGLLGSENPHPFLDIRTFDQKNGVIDFYRSYLEARQTFLEQELKKCERQGNDYKSPHWLKMQRQISRSDRNYGTELAGRYLKAPMNLARGLFLQPIKNWMEQNGNDAFRSAIQSVERTNSVYLLQLYFEKVLDDSLQDFYKAGRAYKIFTLYNERKRGIENGEQFYETSEMNNDLINRIKAWKQTLPETAPEPPKGFVRKSPGEKPVLTQAGAQRALVYYQQNERRLRQIKAQDMALFLMAKELLRMESTETWQGNLTQLKLRDIAPDVEKGPLSEFISFKLTLEYLAKVNEEERKIRRTIMQSRIKAKNYGDFRRFLKDLRLNNLMFYFDTEVVERAVVEREIDEYDRNRIKIFELIRAFEDKVVKRWPESLKPAKQEGNEEDKRGLHQRILDTYFKYNQGRADEAERMGNLRNSHFHNKFPDFTLFPEIRYSGVSSLSARFLRYAEKTYGEFARKL